MRLESASFEGLDSFSNLSVRLVDEYSAAVSVALEEERARDVSRRLASDSACGG